MKRRPAAVARSGWLVIGAYVLGPAVVPLTLLILVVALPVDRWAARHALRALVLQVLTWAAVAALAAGGYATALLIDALLVDAGEAVPPEVRHLLPRAVLTMAGFAALTLVSVQWAAVLWLLVDPRPPRVERGAAPADTTLNLPGRGAEDTRRTPPP